MLVLQDDAEVCRNLPPAVERIAKTKPDEPVVLFCSYLPNGARLAILAAAKNGQCYARFPVSKFVPVVGILWPRACIERFLSWAEHARLPGYPRPAASDDAVVGEWQRRNQETIWLSVPSLVQHPDRVESMIGKRAQWGEDRGRTALYFIGENDPLGYQW